MKNVMIAVLLVTGSLFVVAAGQPALADGKIHYLAIHVDDNDKGKMNMALNNAANVTKYYEAKGETVNIEIVAYGPGLHMLRADTSPVKDRIEAMSLQHENLSFSACGNTKARMSKKAGAEIPILEEATVVTSGVVRLMELQEEGWTYIRP
jgi:intracellular sulfur oxidation DsrE/DsrF family protein